jgi:dihydroxy-acid dehydratase
LTEDLKRNSKAITDGPSRAAARAMFKAVGFGDDDLAKPIIGVANTWTEIGPCNFHLRRIAHKVKEGIRAAGGTPMEFNTVSISDGITMGAEGMKTSLISREVIADSIELVARGNHLDAIVGISACDKTNPGVLMALARLDIPAIALYGGSIMPGRGCLWRSVYSQHHEHDYGVSGPKPNGAQWRTGHAGRKR